MLVRKLKPNEIEEASRIYKESFDKIAEEVIYKEDNIYVVCNESEIMGLCSVDYINDIFRDKKTAYINSVCVSTKYRNQKAALFLLNEIEKICIENKVNEIMLTSNSKKVAANNLYKKLNYTIYDTNVFKKEL